MEGESEDISMAASAQALLAISGIEQDTRFAKFMRKSFDCWFKRLCSINPSLPNLFASGAGLEGGWTADNVSPDNSLVININIFQPFVFLRDFTGKDLDRRFVDETKTGVVNVKLLNVDLSDGQSLRELAIMDSTDGEWYLSPKQCLELYAYHWKMSQNQLIYAHRHDPQMFLETMLYTIYNEEENNASANTPGFDFQIWESWPYVKAMIKTTPCVNCEGWPHVAKDWPRKTKWPGEELTNKIRNGGFHLVHEGSDLHDLPLSWRIVFSKAELELMKSLSANQRKCFVCLKRVSNNIDALEVGLGVKIIKTVLFWDAETYGPNDDVWDIQIEACMERLLVKFRTAIKTGVCEHYFIPEVNIIDSLSTEKREKILAQFDEKMSEIGELVHSGAMNEDAVGKVASLASSYEKRETISFDVEEPFHPAVGIVEDGDEMTSIFTEEFLESTYEKYIRINMATTKKDKERAAECRSKFYHALVALYALALAINYAFISISTHSALMMFLAFLIAGLLLNLGWAYRWSLCFLFSIMTIDSDWSLRWKVVHFVCAFPLAKFISQMMALFERPLEKPKMQANVKDRPAMVLTGTVAKPGLVAPMLFLYGLNLLLMCGSKSQGLRNYWDVVVCTLANHGHFIVFCPWMELFYRDYNRLVVRLRPAICSTVCTSLFVMFMLHYNDYNKAFWPWLVMTCLTIALCCFMCYSLPNRLAIPIYCFFGVMLFLPARPLYTVMIILYAAYWSFLPWHSMPFTRALRVLTLLCVHLCLQTTSLTDILASVNMVFGCSMYIGCLYSFYSAEVSQKNVSLLRRLTSTLMLGTFVGGVALLAFQSKPASTQEAFIQVSAPVSAALLLHSLEGTLLQNIYKLLRRLRVRDGGVANHT